jgi:hypothetical protein
MESDSWSDICNSWIEYAVLGNLPFHYISNISKVILREESLNYLMEMEVSEMSELEPIQYETGTAIRDYDILEITATEMGYDVLLNINLDSGYSLLNTKMEISHDDLTAYETSDLEEGIKFALGFFDEPVTE